MKEPQRPYQASKVNYEIEFKFTRSLSIRARVTFYFRFIAAIWPESQILRTAARIFSGALNVHAATLNRHVGLRHQGVAGEFSGTFESSD